MLGALASRPRFRAQRLTSAELPAHLPGILEIEALCFPRPWGAEEFRADLAGPDGYLDVMVHDGRPRGVGDPRVAAFCSCRRFVDELHVMQIATHPAEQRRGHGTALLVRAILAARDLGLSALLLEVRPSNREAIGLYQKQGFRGVGLRRRYYADNDEDALVMRCDLGLET